MDVPSVTLGITHRLMIERAVPYVIYVWPLAYAVFFKGGCFREQIPRCRARPEKVAGGGGGGLRHIFFPSMPRQACKKKGGGGAPSHFSPYNFLTSFTLLGRGTVRLPDRPPGWQAKINKYIAQRGGGGLNPNPPPPPPTRTRLRLTLTWLNTIMTRSEIKHCKIAAQVILISQSLGVHLVSLCLESRRIENFKAKNNRNHSCSPDGQKHGQSVLSWLWVELSCDQLRVSILSVRDSQEKDTTLQTILRQLIEIRFFKRYIKLLDRTIFRWGVLSRMELFAKCPFVKRKFSHLSRI